MSTAKYHYCSPAIKKDRESPPGPVQSVRCAQAFCGQPFSTIRTAPYIPASLPRTASLNWVFRQAWKAVGR